MCCAVRFNGDDVVGRRPTVQALAIESVSSVVLHKTTQYRVCMRRDGEIERNVQV